LATTQALPLRTDWTRCILNVKMRQLTCIVFLLSEIYDLSRLSQIVLDEADTLLDDSFSQMTIRLIQKLKVELNLAQILKSSSLLFLLW